MTTSNYTPIQSLNKAYRKQKPIRSEFDNFKKELDDIVTATDVTQSEEFNKNIIRDFLLKTFNKDHSVNTKGNTDLAIYSKGTDKIGVIIDCKKPSNNSEMITKENQNKKAMHEVIHYHMHERIEENNDEIKIYS